MAGYGPEGKVEYSLRHLLCCINNYHPAGWCDREPRVIPTELLILHDKTEGGFEDAVGVRVDIYRALRQLRGWQRKSASVFIRLGPDPRHPWLGWHDYAASIRLPYQLLVANARAGCDEMRRILGWWDEAAA